MNENSRQDRVLRREKMSQEVNCTYKNKPFEGLDNPSKELVLEIVAGFNYRNGMHHDDGSRGEIKISPGQFNDALATAITVVTKNIENNFTYG